MNNNDNNYKYYSNYDKNVKTIRGGGVITPSNPPNKKKTTGTINNTWKKNIIPTSPLFKSKYYSNPDLTNGYLNSDDFVTTDKYISNYYYPSQKLDKVNIIDDNVNINVKNLSSIQNQINSSYPIKFPPPLIISKYKNNINKLSKKSNKKKLTDDDYNLIDFIKKNSLYDGKFIYTIENDLNNNNIDNLNKITHIPFTDKLFKLENNIYPNQIINENLSKSNTNENIESFQNTEYKNKTNFNSILNIVLLIIFSILLIIYFSKYQK